MCCETVWPGSSQVFAFCVVVEWLFWFSSVLGKEDVCNCSIARQFDPFSVQALCAQIDKNRTNMLKLCIFRMCIE